MSRSNAATILQFPARKAAPKAAPGGKVQHLTDALLKRLAAASEGKPGRTEIQDSEQRKLYVRIGNGTASFSVFTREPGKANPVRHTLPAHGEINVKQAREATRAVLVSIAKGEDPARAKRAQRATGDKLARTVDCLLTEYLEKKVWNGRALSEATRAKYRADLNAMLGDAMHKPINRLLPEDVAAAYHARRAETVSGAKVAVDALQAMCALHRIPNVCEELKATKQVQKIKVRRARCGMKTSQDLLAWLLYYIDANAGGDAFVAQCQMMVISFTMGLRKESIRQMRWEWLNLRRGELHIPEGVLKGGHAAAVPVPPVTLAMLAARKQTAAGRSPCVFPNIHDASKPMRLRSEFAEWLPVKCTPHDGRKIFNMLLGRFASGTAHKHLMTHSPQDRDVTFKNYGSGDVHAWEDLLEDMREPSNRVEAELLAKRKDREAIKAMDKLHVEHAAAARRALSTKRRHAHA
jgi:integrase